MLFPKPVSIDIKQNPNIFHSPNVINIVFGIVFEEKSLSLNFPRDLRVKIFRSGSDVFLQQ